MRIVSLNAWGGTLHEALLPWIAGTLPDVLCLQEVIHSPAATRRTLTYRDGDHVLPQRANLHAEVCRALPGHAAAFCPAAEGALWDDDAPIPSRWGLATYVAEALPVVGQTQGFVHKGFSPDGFGDHPRSRSAHAVRVFDPEAGRFVTVAQMHGLRDPRGKGDTPERAAQAERLMALMDRTAEAGDLRVICGDFNVEPGSATLALFERRGFVELVTAGGFPGTRSSHYRKPGRFADYMLIDRPEAVRRFDVIATPEISDHLPLELEI